MPKRWRHFDKKQGIVNMILAAKHFCIMSLFFLKNVFSWALFYSFNAVGTEFKKEKKKRRFVNNTFELLRHKCLNNQIIFYKKLFKVSVKMADNMLKKEENNYFIYFII